MDIEDERFERQYGDGPTQPPGAYLILCQASFADLTRIPGSCIILPALCSLFAALNAFLLP